MDATNGVPSTFLEEEYRWHMAQKNNFIVISKSRLLARHCFVANGVMDNEAKANLFSMLGNSWLLSSAETIPSLKHPWSFDRFWGKLSQCSKTSCSIALGVGCAAAGRRAAGSFTTKLGQPEQQNRKPCRWHGHAAVVASVLPSPHIHEQQMFVFLCTVAIACQK